MAGLREDGKGEEAGPQGIQCKDSQRQDTILGKRIVVVRGGLGMLLCRSDLSGFTLISDSRFLLLKLILYLYATNLYIYICFYLIISENMQTRRKYLIK